MLVGTISSIKADRGFGFLRCEGRDYFFHMSALEGLKFDERLIERTVRFEPNANNGKPRAEQVRALED